MAEKPSYDPAREYDLRVAYPLKIGSFKYLPRDQIVAKGGLITRIIQEHGADAIRSAVSR